MPGRAARVGLLALALLLSLAGLGGAQGAVLVHESDRKSADLRVGESADFVFTVRNIHPDNPAFVVVDADAPRGWLVKVDPSNGRLSPNPSGAADNATLDVVVTATARSSDYERGGVTVRFTVSNADGTFVTEHSVVVVPLRPYVLSAFPNPLPPPLDGAYGVFLLDLLAFAVVGAVVILVQEPLLRSIARHTHRPLMDLAVRRLRTPVMVLATFLGLLYSIGVLPPSSFIDLTGRILELGVWVITIYLVYKVFDSLLTYYGLKIASKTETKVDDVLIPLFRKVGVVVAILAGLVLTLRALAIDLTVFVAGGVVISMVLAFAAQETLSNFFSGIHLMVDRPFTEGDYIQLAGGEVCRVERIGLRSTNLYHMRRHELIILPNNKLSSDRVTNLMVPDRKYKTQIEVGVAYGSDVDAVKDTLLGIAMAHPRVVHEGDDAPRVLFVSFGDSALNFWLHVTLLDVTDRVQAPSDMREAIVREFRAKSIEIPFPQRDLWLRTPAEPVRIAPGPRASEARVRGPLTGDADD